MKQKLLEASLSVILWNLDAGKEEFENLNFGKANIHLIEARKRIILLQQAIEEAR